MPTAELIVNEAEFRPTVRRDANGWRGTAHYKVITWDIIEAILADGLPRLGEKWPHPRAPENLRVVGIGDVVLMSPRSNGGMGGGLCRVPIEYSTSDARGTIPLPASANEQWTQINVGRAQVTVYRPVERTGGGIGGFPNAPINDGAGAPVDIATIEVRVYTHRALTATVDLARLNDLSQPATLNTENLTLPPLYGATARIPVTGGQLKYLGYELNVVGELLQVVHIMELRRNHNYEWRLFNEKGEPQSGVIRDRLYEYEPFTGLWT